MSKNNTPRKSAKDKKGVMGRPTIKTAEIVDRICTGLASGKSLTKVCLPDDMPAPTTVYQWVLRDPDFSNKYREAREMQAECHLDEIQDIADDGSNDTYLKEGRNGEFEAVNHELVARSKLRIETRRWKMERMAPKKYGPKTAVDENISAALNELLKALSERLPV